MSGKAFTEFAAALGRAAAERLAGRLAGIVGDPASAQTAADAQERAIVRLLELRDGAEFEVAQSGLTLGGALADSLHKELSAIGTEYGRLAAMAVAEIAREQGFPF